MGAKNSLIKFERIGEGNVRIFQTTHGCRRHKRSDRNAEWIVGRSGRTDRVVAAGEPTAAPKDQSADQKVFRRTKVRSDRPQATGDAARWVGRCAGACAPCHRSSERPGPSRHGAKKAGAPALASASAR